MKKVIKLFVFVLVVLGLWASVVSAHQPKMVVGESTVVSDPEISKAYYGKLKGEPDVFFISATEPFNLYVNVLVPDIEGQKKDVSAVVLQNGKQLVVLDGMNYQWKEFFEPFGQDNYFMGPEYKAQAPRGEYEIRVWSSNNDSKYALAIGEIEKFGRKEGLDSLKTVLTLKSDFFGKSRAGLIFSSIGYGMIIALYVLAIIVFFIARVVTKKFSHGMPNKANRNVGKKDRLLRLAIGLALLVLAITTSWNPLIIFISGLVLCTALFSWCGLYSLMGKNTC